MTLAATGPRLVKDWARVTRPYLQRLRACRAASHTLTAAGQTLTAAGRVDPSCLGAGDFTRIIDAISDLRRADGSLHSAQHLNLLLYLICEVVEHGRASGLMAQVPDPFRAARRQRVPADPNEDELGKALTRGGDPPTRRPAAAARPAGRAGSVAAADL